MNDMMQMLLKMMADGGKNPDVTKMFGSAGAKNSNMSTLLPLLTMLNKNNQSKKPEEKPQIKKEAVYPLSPILDIADKNIIYAMTRYLSKP